MACEPNLLRRTGAHVDAVGLVALITTLFVSILLGQFPVSSDISVWYFGEVAFVLIMVLAIALFGFRTALAGQSLVKAES